MPKPYLCDFSPYKIHKIQHPDPSDMRPFSIDKLLRPNIKALEPYSSARHEYSGNARIYLDANESPFSASHLNRYPDPSHTALRSKISALKDVPPSQIFVSHGSDEAIDLLIRAFCEPARHSILICPPTYGMYQVLARIHNVDVLTVPLTADFQLDLKAITQAIQPTTRIIFLCSPNNPTGNLLNLSDITWLLHHFHGIVAIDEAYIDFAPASSLTQVLPNHPNLVVLQTFSKAWGLAAIRAGIAIATEAITDAFYRIKLPYNLSTLTQTSLLHALDTPDLTQRHIKSILLERQRLATALASHPAVLRVYHSDANFLLIRFHNHHHIYTHLLHHGIVVRDRSHLPHCQGCLRITIGTPDENDQLLKALECV